MGKIDGESYCNYQICQRYRQVINADFIREGKKIVVAYRQEERGQSLADELGAEGVFIKTNAGQKAQVKLGD